MKKLMIPVLLGLMILGGCNQPKPVNTTTSLPGEAIKTQNDTFDASGFVPSGAKNISTVTLEMTGEGAPERAVYFEEDGDQNISLLRKTGEEYEEQRYYSFTHTGENPKHLKQQKAVDLENDGKEELLLHFVSPSLENPATDGFAYIKFIDDDFKFIVVDAADNQKFLQ